MQINQKNDRTANLFKTDPYSGILQYIGEGADNSIHLSDLARLSGQQEGYCSLKPQWTAVSRHEERILRKIIETIRRKGLVIIGDNNGQQEGRGSFNQTWTAGTRYYFPENLTELRSYRQREESRAKSTLYTLKAARQLEKELAAEKEVS